MRWLWLRALVLGLSIGPTGVAAEPPDEDLLGTERASLRSPTGHAVQGPGFHVWEEDAREADAWADELMKVRGTSLERERWRLIAAGTASGPTIPLDSIEAGVTAWSDSGIAGPQLSPLGRLLCLLPSLDRTSLVASWATSPTAATRLMLARALAAPFDAVGVRGAIEHLQADPSPAVRRLANVAAASRGMRRV
jgi:hypothetical protein